ncbi:hypothetical protein P3T21_006066 [Paraburkholderia sp. GAS334]
MQKFRQALTIRTLRNGDSGAPKGNVAFWYTERPGQPTGCNLRSLDGHVQPCCEYPPGALVFESVLEVCIQIQTTIHGVQGSV